jgi:inosine-uridine nucleoside N-ribohydrolase
LEKQGNFMRLAALHSIVLPLVLLYAPGSIAQSAPSGDAQPARYVIADQDASGPGGSDMAALLVLLQSPKVNLLGITVVSGDSWRDVEVAHTLRLLELMGRTDVKVYPGAAFPLVRTQEWTNLASQVYGKVTYMGAWNARVKQRWDEVPDLQEGNPTTKAADEDAAHFMIRMVHQHPHQVTIYGAGPLTNIALAIRLDPHFAELAQELVIMGGSINPHTQAAEWINAPRHEFNFWFDPEAASITLTAKWPKITVTTIDASIQTSLTEVLSSLASSKSNAAQYLIKYARHNNAAAYAWDELAAATWLDPAITKQAREVYMDVNLSHGPNYGDVLTFSDNDKPNLALQKVYAQTDVDAALLSRNLVALFGAATPHAKDPAPLPEK